MENQEKRPEIVYHYCGLDTFFKIIEKNSIRLGNVSKSNDSEELTLIVSKMRMMIDCIFQKYNLKLPPQKQLSKDAVDEVFNGIINDYSSNVYSSSFSKESDLMSQWRGYANNGNGVSIGFKTAAFEPIEKDQTKSFRFGEVKYSTEQLHVDMKILFENMIEKEWKVKAPTKNANSIENALIRISNIILYNSSFYKNAAFKEEAEWRLVFNPYGKTRRIAGDKDYLDCMSELFEPLKYLGGYKRSKIGFNVSGRIIKSYIDLDFSEIKNKLICEIVIGPKADINDNDLRLFLLANGYNTDRYLYKTDTIRIRKSLATYR